MNTYPTIRNIFFSAILLIGMSSCTDTLGELPDFNIKKSDQTEVSIAKHLNGKPAMIVHFDADCKGCQDEAEGIVKNMADFKDVNIAFVSIQQFDKINLFDTYFKLSDHPNIIVGQDHTYTVPNHFKTYTTPLIALLDKNQQVRKVIVGEIEMWELKKFINEIK